MNPSPACIELVKRFEGCRLTAYKCPAGVWTIGWGATGADVRPGDEWSQAKADERLRQDLRRFALGVLLALEKSPTSQAEFDALVCFAYNVGLVALKKSTLLKLHKQGDHDLTAGQFERWVRASGKVLPGLVKRRQAERRLYEGVA